MKRLVVISHVIHYRYGCDLHAFGPYAREIDIWADLFPEVVIAAPCRDAEPKGDSVRFDRDNITIQPIAETGGDTLWAKLIQIVWLPVLILGLCRAMYRADAVHIRCPGNLGFLGVLLARFFCRYRVAKFAGQWNGYRGESLIGRWQRAILKSRWWDAPVTVYGQWENQPAHVHSFFTSMMTDEQIEAATIIARNKQYSEPLKVMFSGRLVPEKRINVLIEAVRAAAKSGVELDVRIVGDGPLRDSLQAQATVAGIDKFTDFVGAQPFDQAIENYEWADCLVLPSVHSEGWPKVVAEAMCHGVICIAVDHGQVGTMLKDRGILLENGDVEQFADALKSISNDPETFRSMAQQASMWSRQYSLEGLRTALSDLLERSWGVPLDVRVGSEQTAQRESVPVLLE